MVCAEEGHLRRPWTADDVEDRHWARSAARVYPRGLARCLTGLAPLLLPWLVDRSGPATANPKTM